MIFTRVKTEDPELFKVQDQLIRAFDQVYECPILNGVLVDSTVLTTSFQNVNHKLGRAPRGWFVVSPNASATVWQDTAANNPDASKYLRVKSSATVTVKIWVF